MAEIISGKETAAKIRERLRAQIDQLREKGYQPGLAVVIVGDDPASQVYVRNKEKACKEVGIAAQTFALPKETTQQELMALIDTLNARSDVHGILVQLPLPRHLDEHQVINAILPEKDGAAGGGTDRCERQARGGDWPFKHCGETPGNAFAP